MCIWPIAYCSHIFKRKYLPTQIGLRIQRRKIEMTQDCNQCKGIPPFCMLVFLPIISKDTENLINIKKYRYALFIFIF